MATTLEYILKEFNMTSKELADKLSISTANISYFIKGTRPIPEKYIPQLSEIFGLPQSFFTKIKLNRVDEIDVQLAYLKKLDDESAEEITDVRDGETYTFMYYPYSREIEFLLQEREKELTLLKISTLLNSEEPFSSNRQVLNMFEDIVKLMNSKEKSGALKTFVYALTEKWGFGKHPIRGTELFEDIRCVLKKHKIIKEEGE